MTGRTAAGARTLAGTRQAVAVGGASPGLIFDGVQNYVSIGTIGSFGSALGSGVYISFQIQVTNNATRYGVCGTNHTGGPEVDVFLNWNGSSVLNNAVCFNMRDASGRRLEAYCTNATLFNGLSHTVVISANTGANTVSITIDGVAQSLTYVSQATPSNFSNFPYNFFIGAWNNNNTGASNNWLAGTISSFQVGTASNALYGSYAFVEGSGTTTADGSGQGNTGQLLGSPPPAWVAAQAQGRGSSAGRFVVPASPIPVIIDTDAASDVDDFGAVALAFRLQQLGFCTVLGINVNTSATYSPGALDAMRKYLGLPAIPFSSHALVGSFVPGGTNGCYQYVYTNFSHDVGLASACLSPTTNLRQLLAARSQPDVVMIGLGYGNDLAALLQSAADGISPLNGTQLVSASCKLLVWTGGVYPSGQDPANFARDLVDAAYVISNWPTPVIFFPGGAAGSSIGGDIYTPNPLSSLCALNPCKAAYQQYGAPDSGHPSWDLCATMIAIEGTNAWTLTQGMNSLNTGTGINTFTPGAGNQYYASNAMSYSYYQNHFTDLLRV